MNGIILAGGKSLRFGEDKAFVKVGDFILIESLIGLLTPLFDNLIIVTNYPEKYVQYPVKVVVDQIKDLGPLGGIQAGLLASDADYNFVMACDMPLVNPELIRFLCGLPGDHEVVLPWLPEGPEPLYAVYSKKALPVIEEHLAQTRCKISTLYEKLRIRKVMAEEILRILPDLTTFQNINLQHDLARLATMGP